MKVRLVKSLFLVLCLIGGVAHAAADATISTPDVVVKQTASGLIDRIESQRSEFDADPEKIYTVIDELVMPHFDFVSMSKWVLGNNWKTASKKQRSDFIVQFQTLLVRTYARALLEYSDQEIKYFPAEINPKKKLAVVKTEMNSAGAQPLPITYRMYQQRDAWKVVDVSVNGVSLVSTYRGSFSTQIKQQGFDSLISQLMTKNAQLEENIAK